MNQAEQLKETLQQMFEIMSEKEFTNAIAKMYRNLFDSFCEQGFTHEQALKILSALKFN